MSDKPRGFPAKYVLLKVLVLPEDKAFVERVKAEHRFQTVNETVRFLLKGLRDADAARQ